MRLYSEADMYWWIDQGQWWSMFLECPNEYCDILYDELKEMLL